MKDSNRKCLPPHTGRSLLSHALVTTGDPTLR